MRSIFQLLSLAGILSLLSLGCVPGATGPTNVGGGPGASGASATGGTSGTDIRLDGVTDSSGSDSGGGDSEKVTGRDNPGEFSDTPVTVSGAGQPMGVSQKDECRLIKVPIDPYWDQLTAEYAGLDSTSGRVMVKVGGFLKYGAGTPIDRAEIFIIDTLFPDLEPHCPKGDDDSIGWVLCARTERSTGKFSTVVTGPVDREIRLAATYCSVDAPCKRLVLKGGDPMAFEDCPSPTPLGESRPDRPAPSPSMMGGLRDRMNSSKP